MAPSSSSAASGSSIEIGCCQRAGNLRRLTLLLRNMPAECGGRGLCRDKRKPDSEEHSLWVGEPSTRGKFMLRLDRPRRPPLSPIEALEVFMNSRLECRSSKDWGLGSSRLRPLPPPGPFWWWRGMAACWGGRGSLRPVPVGISLLTVGAVGLAGLLGRLSDRLSVLSTLPAGATPRSLVLRSAAEKLACL